MKQQTIADIFAANDRIRDRLFSVIDSMNEEAARTVPEGEKWSPSMIVEHVSLVSGGMVRICSKLLQKSEAEGALSDGSLDLTEFARKAAEIADVKLEAPDFVQPKEGLSLAESRNALELNRKEFHDLEPLFEKFDPNRHKYPHPYFGGLTAVEWLALAGGHEARHLRQLERVLEKLELS